MKIAKLALAGALSLTGCVADESNPTVGETEQHSEIDNGTSFNGIALNGIALNGIALNGIALNGIALNGIALNGIALNGIALNGTTWTGLLSNGARLPLRIDSSFLGTGSNSDVGMYGVSYENDTGWQPLCGIDSAGEPILALAVPGTWNYATGVVGGGAYTASDSFTFACRGKSIAKCVELGYKPWNGYADHMQSCIRLLRSDFCGDGTAYTVDGNKVNLYDNVGIQPDTMSWYVEAEWQPSGAVCITQSRMTRFANGGGVVPPCASELARGTTCGTFANGAFLIDEIEGMNTTTPRTKGK
jgi:hypothetical protein